MARSHKQPKIYPARVVQAVEAQIPAEILATLERTGWNALGIYELVAAELQRDKQRQRTAVRKESHSL